MFAVFAILIDNLSSKKFSKIEIKHIFTKKNVRFLLFKYLLAIYLNIWKKMELVVENSFCHVFSSQFYYCSFLEGHRRFGGIFLH